MSGNERRGLRQTTESRAPQGCASSRVSGACSERQAVTGARAPPGLGDGLQRLKPPPPQVLGRSLSPPGWPAETGEAQRWGQERAVGSPARPAPAAGEGLGRGAGAGQVRARRRRLQRWPRSGCPGNRTPAPAQGAPPSDVECQVMSSPTLRHAMSCASRRRVTWASPGSGHQGKGSAGRAGGLAESRSAHHVPYSTWL